MFEKEVEGFGSELRALQLLFKEGQAPLHLPKIGPSAQKEPLIANEKVSADRRGEERSGSESKTSQPLKAGLSGKGMNVNRDF